MKMADGRQQLRLGLLFLISFHTVICCVSLAYVALLHDPSHLKVYYDGARLYDAVGLVAAFALISPVFAFARFSFGYVVGFYFYTMIVGFLWLNRFTQFNYNHKLAALSAVLSAITFLLSALFISSPIRQAYALSPKALDRLLTFILLLGVVTVAVSSIYNFRLVAIENIYTFRDKLEFPTPVRYLMGITSSSLLPFAFACFVLSRDHWRTVATVLVMLLFYPITLSKLALFAPVWLIAIAILSGIFESRIAIMLSLLLPMVAGISFVFLFGAPAMMYFDMVNFRMIAIPSLAMDVYNDFFANHELTYFCQISFLKPVMHCPYQDPLPIVMERVYNLGNFNASLFATEGIASVGLWFAPVSALLCGLVIALGNRVSAGLPARFILISGAILPQVLLNVALTTVLLTHGMAILFLLWYVTPRSIFEAEKKP